MSSKFPTVSMPSAEQNPGAEAERAALADAQDRYREADEAAQAKVREANAAGAALNALLDRQDAGDPMAAVEVPAARAKVRMLTEMVESLKAVRLALAVQVKAARRNLTLAEVVAGVGGHLSEVAANEMVQEALTPIVDELARLYVVLEQADRLNSSAIDTLKGQGPANGYAGQAGAPIQFVGSDRTPDGFRHGGQEFNRRCLHALTWSLENRLAGSVRAKAADYQPEEVKAGREAYAKAQDAKNKDAVKVAREYAARERGADLEPGTRPQLKARRREVETK